MENEATNESPEIQTLINTFTEITSSSKSDAVFFLENYNHNLDAAVSAFLDNSSAAVAVAGKSSDRRDSASEDSKSYSPSNSDDSSSPSPPPPSLRSKRKAQSSNGAYNLRSSRPRKTEGDGGGAGDGGVHTLVDLNRRPTRESESDSDEPREYYTGGEKSGMLIQDPSKANDVDKIFNQARCNAAMEGPLEHLPSSGSGSFSGTARRLTGEAATSVPQPPENVTYTITFWRNGFTVDGGPLRRFDDPTNASFLESIRKSECPKELEPVDTKTSVHVNLTRRQEKCPVVQKRQTSFQGAGRTLGSTSSATPLESTVLISSLTAAPTPSIGLVVDQTQPSTSIQIRLGDGTRMVSRFNLQHTIRDIRGFIDASRPGGSRSYQLQTVGFPPKELINLDQTIEQAGIANSVVIQKL